MKKRRLSDLYVRGVDLNIDDGTGDPVPVRVQKLNQIDRESVLRRANAAKARFMIDADNEESEQFEAMYARVRNYGERAGLVALVISEDAANARIRVEAEVANNEDTWAKDGYLQGLVDAWIGDENTPGLVQTKIEEPNDPDVVRVGAEIERFEAEVAAFVQDEIARLEADWKDTPDEVLWREAAKVMLKRAADEAFAREYERQQLFYSVREPRDHAKRYFATVAEVDQLDSEVRTLLTTQYNALLVEPSEGKDLRATPGSSSSSEATEETRQPSGLEAVSA